MTQDLILYISPFLTKNSFGGSYISIQNLKLIKRKFKVLEIGWAKDSVSKITLSSTTNKVQRGIYSCLGMPLGLSISSLCQMVIIIARLKKKRNITIWIDSSLIGIFALIARLLRIKSIVFFHNHEKKLNLHNGSLLNYINLKKLGLVFGEWLSIRFSGKIVSITETDAKELCIDYKREVNMVLPPVIEPKRYSNPSDDKQFKIGFLGSLWWPNIEALETVIQIAEKFEHVEFLIAGDICKAVNRMVPANIKLLGYVDTIEKFYSEINVCLSPVISGSGLKVKVLEALCHGKIVIGSRHSLAGFECYENEWYYVCENIDEYVARINEKITCQKISQLPEQNFESDVVSANKLIAQLLS